MLPPQESIEELNGLNTAEALKRLYKDVEEVLAEYQATTGKKKQWIWEVLDHRSQHSRFCWVPMVAFIISAVVLLFSGVALDNGLDGSCCLIAQGLLILGLLVFNLSLAMWDARLRHKEMYKKAVDLTSVLKRCSEVCHWRETNYPHLCSPYSPCITLQWTYRDGKVVNLPWALLVSGDTVLIRPGQPAPGHCTPIGDKECPELRRGEVYSPPPNVGGHDNFTQPTARQPLPPQPYTMQETPYLRNLRQCLQEATLRPFTFHDQQQHLLLTTCVEEMAIPCITIFMLLVNGLRLAYVSNWVTAGPWYEMLVLGPVRAVLPLLPLVFPTAWLCLTSYGNARLVALQHSSDSQENEVDPFEETDFGEKKSCEMEVSCVQLRRLFLDILLGQHNSLPRSANLLHVLGSVTALSCVDKKGILSWPNPTAEKVFFLRSTRDPTPNASDSGIMEVGVSVEGGRGSVESENNLLQPTPTHHRHQRHRPESHTVAEQLDLTHDNACPFRLHFDDPAWRRYLSSLKPLGLAILLNTCNMDTQDHYTQFCSHVTCEALYNEDLVPVSNRRCLCELAKQIGFTDGAPEIFTLEQQLSTFRHVQPETVRRDIKFARSLALATKLKFPFPHMVAVIVKDKSNHNNLQLFSQGTADIVLDACVDFYDGSDLHTLSDSDRKKVQDFYQRTSLTAYCTAFAYRPLTDVSRVDDQLSQVYLELPADNKELYEPYRSPTPQLSSMHLDHHQSADSLLTSLPVDENITDTEGCFRIQCSQIFIGMVTMQYQAQTEMVQLIDQLERACIRFVHFSKENELRSRVFSEKMGLESGWNCHISLLSERSSGTLSSSRAMSMSAPSAINLEHRTSDTNPMNEQMSEECLPPHIEVNHFDAWQSLSCLTDSTEQSAPVNFDMSNRAKLPRGIDKIRPHLELVDNVPLLVSLFTDCTVSTTREMIHIMQEYGEIVCVMGSSANADNVGIFLQANASFAVQPLFPQVCQKVSVYTETTQEQGPSPVSLSNQLNSLPCTLQDPRSIFLLIMEARHFMQSSWNCIQYWICGLMTLSAIQLMAAMFPLPPIFSTGQVIWLSMVIIPLLSLSFVAAKTDPQVMQRATSKHQTKLNVEMAVFVLWCYGSKFLLTTVLVPFAFALTLSHHCPRSESGGWPLLASPHPKEQWGGWGRYPLALVWSQHAAALLLVVQLVTISASFVHREYLSWLRIPFKNFVWLTTAGLVLVLQAAYAAVALWWADAVWSEQPWQDLLLLAASPPVIFITNEVVKWQEIKANERYHKRARLDFGTKLGMNSPF
uniref:Uncharacterized protein n=1 Tax=Homalodisca liturata TaxID=320908 RepID=A0A1B6JBX6_9HEMI